MQESGYMFDADVFCVGCTNSKFGGNLDDAVDSEGNQLTAIYPWNEVSGGGDGSPVVCGKCGGEIDCHAV